MKTSIKSLLASVRINAVLLLIISAVTGLLLASALTTYERLQNLDKQERMVGKILAKNRKDPALDRIQAEGTLLRLSLQIDRLKEKGSYGIFDKPTEDSPLIQALESAFERFRKSANAYFGAEHTEASGQRELHAAANGYILALHPLFKSAGATVRRYLFIAAVGSGIMLLWALITAAASRRASRIILDDLRALHPHEKSSRTPGRFATSEISDVAHAYRREQRRASGYPDKEDPLTGLPDYSSVKAALEQRTGNPKGLQSAVCLCEIDDYAELSHHFSRDGVDAVLLKIASILKLHQMQNDLIGQMDEGGFIAVLSRSDKRKAYEDCDHIRQMVAENRFKMSHGTFPVTLSGGFAPLAAGQPLNEAVKLAKSRLQSAKKLGGNRIYELQTNTKIL